VRTASRFTAAILVISALAAACTDTAEQTPTPAPSVATTALPSETTSPEPATTGTAEPSASPTSVPATATEAATPGTLPASVAASGVWLVDVAGGEATLLSAGREELLVLEASFDADGRPLVEYSDREQSWRVSYGLDGSERASEAGRDCVELDEERVEVRETWDEDRGSRVVSGVRCGVRSPDGRLMVYRVDTGDVEVERGIVVPTWDEWMVDLVGGSRTLLREGMRSCGGCDTGYLERWSPSGRYVVLPEVLWPGEVYLADILTGETRLISEVEAATYRRYQPFWAPDGDRLIYPAGNGGTVYEDLFEGSRVELDDLAWPAAFDPSGRYLYSPAWQTGERGAVAETVVFDTATGEVAGVRAGDGRAELIWGATEVPVAGAGEGFVAALEGVDGCDGVTIYRADGSVSACVEGGAATIAPDGSAVAMLQRGDLVVVDIETGAVRVVATGLSTRAVPDFVWSEEGRHLLIRWPNYWGLG
jgi:hypothetical protein